MKQKPNILFICVDQMRFDCISALGHPVVQTPYLDDWIRTGVHFNAAYSGVPSCVPARMTMHTGLSADTHGFKKGDNTSPQHFEYTLAGEFAKAGYHTQAVGKMHLNPHRKLFGFHNVMLEDGYLLKHRRKGEAMVDDYVPWLRQKAGADADDMDHGMDANTSVITRPWHLSESQHFTNWTVSQSIEFLRKRDPEKPYFLFTSFSAPHPPLVPPQSYLEQYMRFEMPEPPIGEWADQEDVNRDGLNPRAFRGIVNPNMRKQALAGYYAMISHIDHQIGRLMIAMRDFGVINNTIVLFTSDHGDMMGDHQMFRKGLPYEGSAHVPLILKDPTGKLNLNSGSTVDAPVDLMDIMPTLLEAAEIPIPQTVEGKSVLALARHEQVPWRDYVYGQYDGGIFPNRFVTNGKEKFILLTKTGEEQFFDLTNDPYEKYNLINDSDWAGKISIWRNRLNNELK